MATKRRKQSKDIEWVGGITVLEGGVIGDGTPYHPAVLIWLPADGGELEGTIVARPGEILGLAGQSLRTAIEEHGTAPTRVRVASAELADVLRREHPAIEFVCAPTPEFDALAAHVSESLAKEAENQRDLFEPDVGPDSLEALFRAGAELFRAAPWHLVLDDQSLFSVTIDALGRRDLVMSVVGQAGEVQGFLLFESVEDYEQYRGSAAPDPDEPLSEEVLAMPPHLALTFVDEDDVDDELRQQVAEEGWELAEPDVYPQPIAMERGLVPRPVTVEDIRVLEATIAALLAVLDAEEALLTAWARGAPFSRTLRAPTHRGNVEVTLSVIANAPGFAAPSDDLIGDLLELESYDSPIDPDAREDLQSQLLRQFAASPEFESVEEVGASQLVMDYAAERFNLTIGSLDAQRLHEIVFEIFPTKLSVDADAAAGLIAECRAFYRFLQREFGLREAAESLEVLGAGAEQKLERLLADPSNFGMAKSFVMGGRRAGYDMRSQAGLDAWLAASGGQIPAASPVSPAPKRRDGKAEAKTKAKRKAARQARKRSR